MNFHKLIHHPILKNFSEGQIVDLIIHVTKLQNLFQTVLASVGVKVRKDTKRK